MKLTFVILSVFLLILTIGAPPVVENVNKDKQKVDSKDDNSDEVVCNIVFFVIFLSISFFS
jgi:hypothetical protein